MSKTEKKGIEEASPFTISVFFSNKIFDYINLSSILHLDSAKNLFPDKLKIDEPPSVAYSLGKTLRNKILNHKETVSSIDPNDDITYGTGILECDCLQHKDFVDENHGHVLTDDPRVIINSKLRKLVSKGSNFHEAMSVNWNKCKREIEIGLDSSIERIISTNPAITTEEFAEWKRKNFQEVDNKILSLKHRIKVHKTEPVLKQKAVIEYLHELHELYVLVPIDKAANNIVIICKKCYVTVILKEIGILDAFNETYEKMNTIHASIYPIKLKMKVCQ